MLIVIINTIGWYFLVLIVNTLFNELIKNIKYDHSRMWLGIVIAITNVALMLILLRY